MKGDGIVAIRRREGDAMRRQGSYPAPYLEYHGADPSAYYGVPYRTVSKERDGFDELSVFGTLA